MGRKHLSHVYDSDTDSDVDPEMNAEMQAVQAIYNEKHGIESDLVKDNHSTGYNKEGLLQKCAEMGTDNLSFLESFQLCDAPVDLAGQGAELDDLEREMQFYNHSVAAVIAGRKKLEAAGVPHRRPLDYFCEHFKDDMHMARIKDRLLLEQKKIEGFEARKQRENNKKFNKQVQEVAKKAKKEKGQQGVDELVKDAKEKGKRGRDEEKPEKSAKRIKMDKKYGIGSKKSKISDKKSLNDMTDFNPRGGKFVRREGGRGGRGAGRGGAGRGGAGRGGAGGGRGKGASRPGKEARARKASGRGSR